MREILFRGKRIDNGEWVTGDLIHDEYESSVRIVIDNEYSTGTTFVCNAPRVDPNTICEYVGTCDKKGNKIFEHDIVNCKVLRLSANDGSWCQIKNKEHGKCRVIPMEVYYVKPYTGGYPTLGGFSLRPTKKALELIKEYEKPVGKETKNQIINWYNIQQEDLIEVIGNSVDNPELLEDK